jgi:O-antigen ligase/polysaccharide polymerase Wzy-like membrane protein/tetratricopeptide repeat protein
MAAPLPRLRTPRRGVWGRISRWNVSEKAGPASPFLLGAALAGVAFGAAGGTELGRTTVVELLLVAAGTTVLALAILDWREGTIHGGLAVLLFCALVGVTALSVLWSIAPELSFVEASRSFAYLAVFAAAVALARLAPRASPVLLQGILLACVVVTGYALASRVFPGTLAENELSGRIGEPYAYWNAVGTTAALIVPGALWLGSRRSSTALVKALAYPALGLAVVAILLSQSRGALVAALCGAALWLLLVPLRLRSLPVLLVPVAGAAPVAAWALSKDAFSRSLQPLAAKQDVATEFGVLLVVMTVLLAAAGVASESWASRKPPPARVRRRIGIAAVALVCAIPFVLFTSVAVSARGLGGTVRDRWHELTSETASTPGGPGRLTAASSSRGRYWRQAGHVFADRPIGGTGAGTFAVSRLRYRKDELVSRHVHGYIPQTLADTGLVGLAVTLGLLGAWLAAAARATGLYPRWRRGGPVPRRDWNAERLAIVALTLVVVVFGLQSAIDWTWFVPGPAVMALLAAGFVAGRGPLRAAGPEPDPYGQQRLLGLNLSGTGTWRVVLASAVAVTGLLCAWAIWQPERSDRDSDHAVSLATAGKPAAALEEAEDAHRANPLSPRPLLVKAAVQSQGGQNQAARSTLETAVLHFPGDPQTWIALTQFQLHTQNRPAEALETVGGALYLDPFSKAGRALFLEARARDRAAELQRSARAKRQRRR